MVSIFIADIISFTIQFFQWPARPGLELAVILMEMFVQNKEIVNKFLWIHKKISKKFLKSSHKIRAKDPFTSICDTMLDALLFCLTPDMNKNYRGLRQEKSLLDFSSKSGMMPTR
jgi:hypothetical protein